jgi:peptidoglycan-associated lipoprotein
MSRTKEAIMKFIQILGLTSMIGVAAFFASCSKKVTNVSAMPQPTEAPAVAVQPATPQPAPAAPRDSFVIVNADSILRATLRTVYFDFDKSDIRTDAIPDLEKIGRLLMERKEVSLLLEGNCDERGSAEYNMGLGQHRAQAIKDWLVTYGIGDNRLETTSYGKERPAFQNCQDETCHAQNRRVEFKVLSGSSGPVSLNLW